MADSSVARGRIGGPDFFADDDPLAELARIAGYEERAVAIPQPSASARREPSFNLEDELLREFEQYEEPRSEPVVSVANSPARAIEPELPVSRADVDPFADAEPDGIGTDERTAQREALTVASGDNWSLPVTSLRSETGYAAMPAAPVAVSAAESPSGIDELGADLIAELETSLAAPVMPATSARTPGRGAYEPGFRMPLTNFAVAPPRSQPAVSDAALRGDPSFDPPREPVASTWATDFASDVAAVRARPPVQAPQPVALAPVEPVLVPPPVPEVLSLQGEVAQAFEVVEEPGLTPEIEPERVPQQSAPLISPVISEMRVEPAFAPVIERTVSPERKVLVSDPAPDLMDDDFELMLDDLELELADLEPEEKPRAAPAVASRPEPVVERVVEVAAPPAPPMEAPVAPRAQPVATLAPEIPAFLAQSRLAPAVSQETVVAEPVRASQAGQAAPASEDGDSFDPALLAEADEMPEAVPDLDVPEIPVHEPEKPVAAPSDFELDLDSELASYLDTAGLSQRSAQQAQNTPRPQDRPLGRATAVAPASVAAAGAVAHGAVAAPVTPKTNDGLDDFERALEEDFRRSLATPLRPTPMDEDYAEEAPVYMAGGRSMASYALPLSVAGFVAIVGISIFAWYATGKSTTAGDGSPVVIAADSEPVKVVPENPGGKVVPNQDKAVYDRVASGSLNDPKQSSLISSEEQPVDVVQKTLTPENLPLQGEDEAQAEMTPVGETQDARLLPTDGHAKPSDAEQLAVMPRRVKTMIVRPDGTLVEQVTEVPAGKPVSAPATPVTTEKVPAAPALAEPTQLASTGPAANSKPTNLSDVNVARTTALTGAADAAAPTTASVPAGVPAPKAPVPTARPTDQPVQVVAAVTSQGTVRNDLRPAAAPSAAPQAAAPAAVPAAAAPAAQSAQAGGYFIQIASLPSEADAQKSYRNLSSKFAGVIGGRSMDIAKAEVAGKGTFYRVRVAAGSTRDEAAALCERYRAAGGTCLIAR